MTPIPDSAKRRINEAADKYLHPYTDHCGVAKYCIHDILCAFKSGAEFGYHLAKSDLESLLREAKEWIPLGCSDCPGLVECRYCKDRVALISRIEEALK